MRWLNLVGGALAVPLCVACGGSEFGSAGETGGTSSAGTNSGGSTAGGSSSGGSSFGGAAGSSSAGTAGSFPGGNGGVPAGGTDSGGTGGGGASGGNNSGGAGGGGTGGGSSCKSDSCVVGEYCDEDTGKCESCAAPTTRLRFSPPVRMNGPNTTGVDDRFPRLADDKTLWWRRAEGSPGIVYAPPPYAGSRSVFRSNSSGYIPREINLGDLIFDAAWDQFESNGTRRIYAVSGMTTFTLPSVNQAAGQGIATQDYSLAVSASRVWWMTDRSITGQTAGKHLVTYQPGIVFNVDFVPLVLPDDCHARGDDFAPWSTPEGDKLLFAAQESSGGTCSSTDNGPRDLYWASVDGNGQQVGKATRIDISQTNLDDTEPSLSKDLCTLYFARAENENDGKHDIWTAMRR